MTNVPRPELVNIIISLVTALLLICLFIFPRQYLVSFSKDITLYAESIRDGVINNDDKKISKNAAEMLIRFDACSDSLKLFLNHEDVDKLKTLIYSCYYRARIDEKAAIIGDVESIVTLSEYLFDVETLSVYNLF